jgi:hypothetical protein
MDKVLTDAARQHALDLIDAGITGLEAMVTTANNREREASQQRQQLEAALSADAIGAAAAADTAVAAGLSAARQRLAQANDGADARMTALRQAQAEWDSQLQALRRLLS